MSGAHTTPELKQPAAVRSLAMGHAPIDSSLTVRYQHGRNDDFEK